MLTSELQYELPSDRIAQSPCAKRDESRLLVYRRSDHSIAHHLFHELPDLLPPKLSILRNDVSVLKARLPGQRPTGGAVECLLLRPADPPESTWRCLLKPGAKTAKAGTFGQDGEYSAKSSKASHPESISFPSICPKTRTHPLWLSGSAPPPPSPRPQTRRLRG